MKKILFILSIILLINNLQSQELIADPKFQKGFTIVNEAMDSIGNIHTATGNNPAWELAELYSQTSLLDMTPTVEPSGFYRWSNNFKDFRVGGPENSEDYDYYIGVNSQEEWNDTYMPTTEQEEWPAFLIQQRLSAPFRPNNNHGPGCPTIAEMTSLDFSMDAKLVYNQTIIESGYDSNHHAAQFPIYFTVQNLNPSSSGYGQYIWLGILVYDDRYTDYQGNQMIDVATQALIWTLPDNASRTESLHSGNWVELSVDLLPYAKQALQDAWNNGIMTASTDYSDYRIGGFNMGWENPGMNICTMETRDLSLIANTSNQNTNNSEFISQVLPNPASIPVSSTMNVTLTFKNTGTSTWSSSAGYHLGSQNAQDNTTWGVNRIELPNDVAPGEEVTITTDVTAPSTPGQYNFQWQLLQDGAQWFGDFSDNVAVTVYEDNNSEFVSQVLPDPAIIPVSSTMNVTLTFKNTGSSTWSSGAGYHLGSQNAQDNTTWGVNRIELPNDVAPGETVTITTSVTAPNVAGQYNFQWQLLQDGAQWFGDFSDNIVVTVSDGSVNYSHFVSQLYPTQIAPGDSFYVELTFKNEGTTTWQAGNNYNLGSQNAQDNTTWGTNRISLQNNVAPGEQVTITAILVSPTVEGTYNFQWKMVQDGVGWFGDLSTNVTINVATINNSNFVSQLYPTQIATNDSFYVELTFQNIGTTTWEAGNDYVLGSQNTENNQTWGTGRIYLQNDVAPGEQVTITAILLSPATEGVYNFQWRLLKEGVEWFGDFTDNVTINVTNINAAQYISQIVPTQVTAGDDFNVEITFKNTGTTTWADTSNYRLGSQNPQDDTTWGRNRIEIPNNVISGQEITINTTLTAPNTIGTYNFQWQMVQDGVGWFGDLSTNVTINVVSQTVYNEYDEATICQGEQYTFGNQTLTTAGVYQETFTSVLGTDSTVTLTLNVTPTYNEVIDTTICQGNEITFGTQTLNTAGQYTEVFNSQAGCDSTVILNLTVDVCNGVSSENETLDINVFPNPNNGIFSLNIRTSATLNIATKLFDITGKLIISKSNIKENTEFDLRKYPKGVYFLQITSNNFIQVKKIIIQ